MLITHAHVKGPNALTELNLIWFMAASLIGEIRSVNKREMELIITHRIADMHFCYV